MDADGERICTNFGPSWRPALLASAMGAEFLFPLMTEKVFNDCKWLERALGLIVRSQ